VAKGFASAGLKTAYHNHDFEFETMDDGQTGWDHIFHGGDAQLGAEMDTCWVAVGKHDPVDEMKKLTGRVPLLHIKDCSDFDAKTLCEVGTGKVDIKAILAAAEDVGAEYLVVEQDNNWIDGDCVKSAKISFENLKSMF
ncbi:MAG: sugar phosphate isomerase/epimerase, partial [Planctomycetota bacterium]